MRLEGSGADLRWRYRAFMSLPAFLHAHGEVLYLHVKVQPRAPRHEIGQVLGGELKVKIAAAPVDSAANEALIEFLAHVLDCSRSAVELVRGQTARHKVVAIHGLLPQKVVERLTPGKHD